MLVFLLRAISPSFPHVAAVSQRGTHFQHGQPDVRIHDGVKSQQGREHISHLQDKGSRTPTALSNLTTAEKMSITANQRKHFPCVVTGMTMIQEKEIVGTLPTH